MKVTEHACALSTLTFTSVCVFGKQQTVVNE